MSNKGPTGPLARFLNFAHCLARIMGSKVRIRLLTAKQHTTKINKFLCLWIKTNTAIVASLKHQGSQL